jgi:hypothetical protein
MPQRPQWATVVRRSISQPSSALPLQSPNPVLQTTVQRPSMQPAVPLAVVHVRPHAPQLRTSVPRAVSHPLDSCPSQSPYPASQPAIRRQPPSMHAAVA